MGMICPRRAENPGPWNYPEEDHYTKDGQCSYCGSLNPDIFMARLEKGDVKLVPTDKDYKVYVKNDGGEKFYDTYRTDDKPFQGWDSPEHTWVTREMTEQKFYFLHLSTEQKKRFVELMNEKKLKYEYPGHFYKMPFFITREPRQVTDRVQ